MDRNKSVYALALPRAVLIVLHYFIGYLYAYPRITSYLTLMVQPRAIMILPSLQMATYILTAGVSIALAWPIIKHSIQVFRESKKECFKLIGVLFVTTLCANMVLNIIVSTLTNTTQSENQDSIQMASMMVPFITIFATCVFSPIVEELVFRGGAFSCLRKRTGFLTASIFSSILFGSIHVLTSLMSGNFSDASYLLVYTGIGMVMAYGYEKSGTLVVPIGIHMLNNILSVIAMFLVI